MLMTPAFPALAQEAAPIVVAPAWVARYAAPQQQVALPDGRRMNLYCTGQGAPTVILESGLTISNLSWAPVQSDMAESAATRVCAYDRAGMGFSDEGPGERDTEAQVEDLEALLAVADLPGPYIMVGHSMGGLTARLFTDRNRDRVVGMLLVDPSVEHQDRRFADLIPKSAVAEAEALATMESCVAAAEAGNLGIDRPGYDACNWLKMSVVFPEPLRSAFAGQVASPAYQRTMLSEFRGMRGSGSDQVAASRRAYGDLPLIVLTRDVANDAGYTDDKNAAGHALLVTLHQEVAALSTRGQARVVPNADHYMQLTVPRVLVEAVRELAVAARVTMRE